MHQWLQRQGQQCGRHRGARLLRGQGLRSQSKRRFRVSLTDSHHDLPIAPNRLRAAPLPTRRAAVWVADITCIDTAEGWLYVAVCGLGHPLGAFELSIPLRHILHFHFVRI